MPSGMSSDCWWTENLRDVLDASEHMGGDVWTLDGLRLVFGLKPHDTERVEAWPVRVVEGEVTCSTG